MAHCINVKHSEVVELAKQLKVHPAIVASKIAVWQETNNNFDRFPTIDELKSISTSKGKFEFNKEQKEAINKATEFIKSGNPKDFFLIQGKAGTGKTTIAEQIVKQFPGKSVYVAALSNKAKGVIEQTFNKANVKASFYSIAGLTGQKMDMETGKFDRKPDDFSEIPIEMADIVILDEGSMINEQALELVYQYKPANAKVIVLADIGQLPPIRTVDNPYYQNKEHLFDAPSPVFNTKNKVFLTERVRQGEESPILPYADYFWNNSQKDNSEANPAKERKNIITDKGALLFVNEFNAIKEQVVPFFKRAIETNNPNYIKVVTYRNNIRQEINKYIHNSVFGKDAAEFNKGEIIIFNAPYGEIENSTETQILKISELKTDRDGLNYYTVDIDYDVETPTIKVIAGKDKPKLQKIISEKFQTARANKGKPQYRDLLNDAWNLVRKYADIDYAYALTSHKSQGSTYDHVIVNEKDIMGVSATTNKSKSQSIYTAITRARNTVTIVSSTKIDTPIDNITPVLDKFKPVISQPVQVTPQVEEEEVREVPEVTIETFNRPDTIYTLSGPLKESDINNLLEGVSYNWAKMLFNSPELVKQFITPDKEQKRTLPEVDLEELRDIIGSDLIEKIQQIEDKTEELKKKIKNTEQNEEIRALTEERNYLVDILHDVLGYGVNTYGEFIREEQPKNFLMLIDKFNQNLKVLGLTLEKEEEAIFEEAINDGTSLASIPAMYLDPKKSMSATIRLLISSIAKMDKHGIVLNRFGQIVPMNSNEGFNTLALHLTENLPQGNFEKQQERIRELGKSRPEFLEILRLLGNTHPNADLVEENFRTEFVQTFSQTKLNFLNSAIRDHEHQLLDANQETTAKKIRNLWRATYLDKINKDNWKETKEELIKLNKSLKFTGTWTPELISKIRAIFNSLGLSEISDETIKADYSNKNNKENIITILERLVSTGLKRENLMFEVSKDNRDVTGRINQIVNEESKHSPDSVDLQILDQNNKPIYGISLNTYLSELVQELNYYATHDPAMLESQYGWLFDSPFNQGSLITQHLRKGKEIQLSIHRAYSSDETTSAVAQLDTGAMVAADMTAIFNNKNLTPVTGDREVKIMWSTGENIISFDHAPSQTEDYLLNHLKAEMEAATTDNLDVQYLGNRTGKLRLLQDIFGDHPLVQAKLKLELTREEIESFVKTNEQSLRQYIKTWLENVYLPKSDQFFKDQRLKDTYEVSKREGDKKIDTVYNTEIPQFRQVGNQKIEITQEEAIKYYSLTKLVSLIEAQKFFFGDPAVYKSPDDAMKRFSMFTSSKQVSRTDRAYNEWLVHHMGYEIEDLDNPTLKVWTIKDPKHTLNNEVKTLLERQKQVIKEDLDKANISKEQKERLLDIKYKALEAAYTEFKSADSQGYMDDLTSRQIHLRTGTWLPIDEEIYQDYLSKDLPVPLKYWERLQSEKTQYVGPIAGRDYIPTSLKHSLLRLNAGLVKGTAFEEVVKLMKEQGINVIQISSGVKFGAILNNKGTLDDLFINKKVNPNPESVHDIYWKFFGRQQLLAPSNKTEGTFGVQPRKLVLQNAYKEGKIVDKSVEPLIKRYNDTQKLVFENQWQDWLKKSKLSIQTVKGEKYYIVNDRQALVDSLLDVVNKRLVSNNTKEAIESFLDENVLLDAMPEKRKLESILLSPIREALSREYRNGGMRVLTAHHGFEFNKDNIKEDNTLKFYTSDGTHPTTPTEVILPPAYGQFLKKGDKIVFFRIPATGLASMDVAVVKDFAQSGDIIMVSPLLLPKTNADHDVDKIIMFLPNYDDNDQYIASNGTSKEALENRLLEITTQLILHPSRFKDLTTPVGAGIIQDTGIRLGYVTNDEAVTKAKMDDFSMLKDFRVNFEKAYQFHSGKGLISNLSIYTTMFPLMQKAGIYRNTPDEDANIFMSHNTMEIDGVVYPSLSAVLDTRGNRIMELFTEYTQHSMDVQNKPTISELGVNEYTIGVVSMLTAHGAPVEAIQRLLNHEIVKAFVQTQRVNDRPSRDRGYLNNIENNLTKHHKGLIEKFIKDQKLALNYDNLLSTLEYTQETHPTEEKEKDILKKREGLKEFSSKHTFEDGDKSIIGSNSFREEVLEMYLEYERQATKYTAFALSSRPDADSVGGNSVEAFKTSVENRKSIVNSGWFGNIEKFFEDTFLAPIYESTNKMYYAFDHMILALNHSRLSSDSEKDLSEALKELKSRYQGYKRGKKRERFLNLMDSDFATAILMHPSNIFGYNKNKHLFEASSDTKTVQERLIAYKQSNSPIYQNPLIKLLTPMTDGKLQSIIIPQRNLDVKDENSVVNGYEELHNSTNPEIKQFAEDLLKMSVIQGGLGLGRYNLTKILPTRTMINAITPIFSDFLKRGNKAQTIDSFEKAFIEQNPTQTYRAKDRGFKSEESPRLAPVKYIYRQDAKSKEIYLLENKGPIDTKKGKKILFTYTEGVTPEPNQKSDKIKKYWDSQKTKQKFKSSKDISDQQADESCIS